jgi:hypothetical protein
MAPVRYLCLKVFVIICKLRIISKCKQFSTYPIDGLDASLFFEFDWQVACEQHPRNYFSHSGMFVLINSL